MKRIAGLVLLALVAVVLASSPPAARVLSPAAETVGCGPVNAAPLVPVSEKLGMCILQAAVGDLVEAIADPVSLVQAVIGACRAYGVATIEQVIAIIEEAISSPPAVDAGAAPLSAAQHARLEKVHAAALALKASGKK